MDFDQSIHLTREGNTVGSKGHMHVFLKPIDKADIKSKT